MSLTRVDAERLADCALGVVQQRYPHKLDHLIRHADDHPLPHAIHPVFDGCYDWHSSVHMHWSLLRLCRAVPELSLAPAIAAHFDAHFTPDNVAVERDYAGEPGRGGFERPYGWAWLLKLQSELNSQARDGIGLRGGHRWAQALQPFSTDVAARLANFLAASHYPVRAGTHANSAFAMLLALDYARSESDVALRNAIDASARAWFASDRDYPIAYEPGGNDFLSPGLCEALLMREVLGGEFGEWWRSFAPDASALDRWLAPAIVSDRSDAQGVHLDGLNLSRAWCLAALASSLSEPQAQVFRDAADAHWTAAWPQVTGGDFVATHWLVSFALLALDARHLSVRTYP